MKTVNILRRNVPVRTGGGTVDDYQIYFSFLHLIHELIPTTLAIDVATAIIILRMIPHVVLFPILDIFIYRFNRYLSIPDSRLVTIKASPLQHYRLSFFWEVPPHGYSSACGVFSAYSHWV